ncbi:acyltransferase family protein [Arenicella xantha]|uniref:Peptidoglycan/LPS O-acetylase OafA/YrhL n=1 Tax=Arenicella xantha TaxID=644221 RepID=A0A395JK57_9GAMM|nr:acyltransferase family protein [Arenicella xantha]RBP51112.1 peptidoglycan/LPS O-acetylase OafA/YrhL [Arenicella xantha]
MLKYRPDIDGLRAIAVASVVLFHLQESLLPGGFVGVDIFFVISGYLITKLIYSELSETGQFSFKRFYIRRVRRLFPALFSIFLLCLVLAYLLFSPSYLVEFAQSLITAFFSVSNIFFWSISDYFNSDSSVKPLLHTWSLSVEEQFYLLWPATLVGLFALNKKPLIPAFIVLVGVASLLLNLEAFSDDSIIMPWIATQNDPISNNVASTAFYWLPFRVFEFSIGAILVWLAQPKRQWLAECAFAAGLSMILLSIFALDSEINFPSTAALIPTIGAALMIFSGGGHRLSWLVSNRLMVRLGLISYSLYLIHWPLIVFYKYSIGRAFWFSEIVLLTVISLIVASLMYRFIEQPFRKPNIEKESIEKASTGKKATAASPNRRFLIGSACATLITIAISANAISSHGWLWRYPPDVVAQLSYQKGDYTEFFWADIKRLEAGFQNNDKPKVLIIGDSMAANLVNVLVAANASEQLDMATIMISHNCKTLFGFTDNQYLRIYRGAATKCQREHDRVLAKTALLENADTIVLASHLWNFNKAESIPGTVAHLKTLSDAKVMVLGLKVQRDNGIVFLSKHAFSPQVHTLRTLPHPKTVEINDVLKSQANDYIYFDLLDGFCNEQGCQRVTKDGYAIIFDESHLSENGAKLLAQNIHTTDWFKHLLERKQ